MSEWWSYRAADLLLFSPRTYWRLFELENASVWPLPLIAPLVAAALVALSLRPISRAGSIEVRILLVALGVAWAWTGWSFVHLRYAPVNWAADYLAPLFAVQAGLLVWAAFGRNVRPVEVFIPPAASRIAGLLLIALAVGYPALSRLSGRALSSAEVVGIAPDPTATATLGIVLLARLPRFTALLLPIPLLWLGSSAAVLHTMGNAQAFVPLASATATIAMLACRFRHRHPSTAKQHRK